MRRLEGDPIELISLMFLIQLADKRIMKRRQKGNPMQYSENHHHQPTLNDSIEAENRIRRAHFIRVVRFANQGMTARIAFEDPKSDDVLTIVGTIGFRDDEGFEVHGKEGTLDRIAWEDVLGVNPR
jgi:hypothetical protein